MGIEKRPHYLIYSSTEDWLYLAADDSSSDFKVISNELSDEEKREELKSCVGPEMKPEICILIDSADCFVVDAAKGPKLSEEQKYYELESVLPIDAEEMQLATFRLKSRVEVVINKKHLGICKSCVARFGACVGLIAPLAAFLLQARGKLPEKDEKIIQTDRGKDCFRFSNRQLTGWTWSPTTQATSSSLKNQLLEVQNRGCFLRPWISFSGNAKGSAGGSYQTAAWRVMAATFLILIAISNFYMWTAGSQFYIEGRNHLEIQRQIARQVVPGSRQRVDTEGFLASLLKRRESDQAVVRWVADRHELSDLENALSAVSEVASCQLKQFGVNSDHVFLIGSLNPADRQALVSLLAARGLKVSDIEGIRSLNQGQFSWKLSREGKS